MSTVGPLSNSQYAQEKLLPLNIVLMFSLCGQYSPLTKIGLPRNQRNNFGDKINIFMRAMINENEQRERVLPTDDGLKNNAGTVEIAATPISLAWRACKIIIKYVY